MNCLALEEKCLQLRRRVPRCVCRAVRRCRRSSGLSTPVLDRDAGEPVILHELSVSVRDQVEAAFALCLARSTRASAMLSMATQMSGAWLWQRADDPGPIWWGPGSHAGWR